MSKKFALIFCLTLLFIAVPVSARDATPPGLLREKVMQKLEVRKNLRASLKQAKLLTKSNTVLTVEKDSKTYSINITDKTQLRRRFGGIATLAEFSLGDLLDIHGNVIRDTSIQLRFGTFFGTVTSISGNTIVIQPEKRDSQTVIATSSAKIINRKQQKINLSDILVGHKIRAKGLWNNLNNTITEVKELKDFTLPIVLTHTLAP